VAVSQVFSDPPMNLADATVDGGRMTLAQNESFALPDHLRELEPGRYRLGVRPAHLGIAGEQPQHDNQIVLASEVEVAEIAGSETFIHTRYGDSPWVLQL